VKPGFFGFGFGSGFGFGFGLGLTLPVLPSVGGFKTLSDELTATLFGSSPTCVARSFAVIVADFPASIGPRLHDAG
jgi:hypothetical protein